MSYRIDADASPGAYDGSDFQRRVALPEQIKFAALEARPEPEPFRAREKLAALVTSPGGDAELGEIRREVLGAFVKRALLASDLRAMLLEKRAASLVETAAAEGWDEERFMAEWTPLAKEAMGGFGSSGIMKQYWSQTFPDRKSMGMKPVAKKVDGEKTAGAGASAAWWAMKAPFRLVGKLLGRGGGAAAKTVGKQVAKRPLAAAGAGVGTYFTVQDAAHAARPLHQSLPRVSYQ